MTNEQIDLKIKELKNLKRKQLKEQKKKEKEQQLKIKLKNDTIIADLIRLRSSGRTDEEIISWYAENTKTKYPQLSDQVDKILKNK